MIKDRPLPGLWMALHAADPEAPEAVLDMVRLCVVELSQMPLNEGRRAASELPINEFKAILDGAMAEMDMGNSPTGTGSVPASVSELATQTQLDSVLSQLSVQSSG